MKWHSFFEVVTDATSKFTKIKASDYCSQGKYKIIDQGKEPIAGYTDDTSLVNRELLPILIFGDHTRVLKYEDDPIALGADGAKALWVNPELADARYVHYYLRSIQIKEAGYSRHFKFLKEVEIPIPFKDGAPNFDDQKRIVHLLGKVEGLIAQRKQHLQQLDNLLKSVFLEMFGNQNLDTTLGKECQFSQGIQIPIEEQYSEKRDGFIRFLRIIDYTQADEPRYIAFPGERFLVKSDDVVMVRYGASAGFVGFGKSGIIANNLFKFNFDKTRILPIYLCFCLKTQRFDAFIKKKVFGAAMPALSFGIMKDYAISVPPIELQNQFATIVEKAESLKSRYRQSLTDLETLYGALSQKAFKGELDLSRVPLV